MKKIQAAIDFAAEKHKKQTLCGRPYIAHPLLVYELVKEVAPTRKSLHIAALLHDTLEDTFTSPLEIKKRFGKRVASLVIELTDANEQRKKLGSVEYYTKKLLLMSVDALVVKLADRLAHIMNIFNMPLEKTLENAETSRKVIDNIAKNKRFNTIQKKLVTKFNNLYCELNSCFEERNKFLF